MAKYQIIVQTALGGADYLKIITDNDHITLQRGIKNDGLFNALTHERLAATEYPELLNLHDGVGWNIQELMYLCIYIYDFNFEQVPIVKAVTQALVEADRTQEEPEFVKQFLEQMEDLAQKVHRGDRLALSGLGRIQKPAPKKTRRTKANE